jgi:hypothetical protein
VGSPEAKKQILRIPVLSRGLAGLTADISSALGGFHQIKKCSSFMESECSLSCSQRSCKNLNGAVTQFTLLIFVFVEQVYYSKAVPLHAMKALGGEEVYLLLILDCGSRWG